MSVFVESRTIDENDELYGVITMGLDVFELARIGLRSLKTKTPNKVITPTNVEPSKVEPVKVESTNDTPLDKEVDLTVSDPSHDVRVCPFKNKLIRVVPVEVLSAYPSDDKNTNFCPKPYCPGKKYSSYKLANDECIKNDNSILNAKNSRINKIMKEFTNRRCIPGIAGFRWFPTPYLDEKIGYVFDKLSGHYRTIIRARNGEIKVESTIPDAIELV